MQDDDNKTSGTERVDHAAQSDAAAAAIGAAAAGATTPEDRERISEEQADRAKAAPPSGDAASSTLTAAGSPFHPPNQPGQPELTADQVAAAREAAAGPRDHRELAQDAVKAVEEEHDGVRELLDYLFRVACNAPDVVIPPELAKNLTLAVEYVDPVRRGPVQSFAAQAIAKQQDQLVLASPEVRAGIAHAIRFADAIA